MNKAKYEKNKAKEPSLLGAKLSLGPKEELLNFISQRLASKKKTIVASGNAHSYNLSYEMPWFRAFLNVSDWVRMDGIGVIMAARLLGYSVSASARMTWADFMWDLALFCERHAISLYFLGGRPGVGEKAATNLKNRFKDLRIVGIQHGYFHKRHGSSENGALINRINLVKPDILVVGFGMPLQERWLVDNVDHLNVNVTFTAGAVFDYVSGELRRPPLWVTKNGLEWMGRLAIEPKRLWRRYLIGNFKFFIRVVKQRMNCKSFQSRSPDL